MSVNPTSSTSSPKYLALGDSYTIGTSVEEPERFPAQAVELLKKENINVSNLQYIATRGWTTFDLMASIREQNPSSNFDIVTLLIGVNDQYDGIDIAKYEKNFAELLATAIELSGNRPSRVFVLSIPDYSAVPFIAASDKARVSKEVEAFNAVNKKITLENNIAYIDITPSTKAAIDDLSLVASDNLHPSGKEYQKWAELVAPSIISALKEDEVKPSPAGF